MFQNRAIFYRSQLRQHDDDDLKKLSLRQNGWSIQLACATL